MEVAVTTARAPAVVINENTKFGTTSSAQMKRTSLFLVVDAVSRCEKRQRADKGGSAQKINLKIIMNK